MAERREKTEGLLVGMLMVVVVLLAYMVFVQPQPPPSVSAPGNPHTASSGLPAGPVPGRGGALHMREYLAGIVALESEDKLHLTPQQARELLPVLQAYNRVDDAVPSARSLLASVLTPQQTQFLEKEVPRRPPSPDPRHTAEELLDAAVERVLKALSSR